MAWEGASSRFLPQPPVLSSTPRIRLGSPIAKGGATWPSIFRGPAGLQIPILFDISSSWATEQLCLLTVPRKRLGRYVNTRNVSAERSAVVY